MESRELQLVLELKDRASKELKGFRGQIEKMQPAFEKMALMGTAAFAGISVAMGNAIQKAGDAEKIAANFETTFGESGEAIKGFIRDFGDEFAFVESELMKGANSIGFQLNAMGGITEQETEKMTKSLLTASGALSDFFGSELNVTQAAQAMADGLAGQSDRLRNMGFNVLDEDIEKAAKEMGIMTDELTKQQEAQVLTKLIMEQTQGSVEGLNSTLDTFTGQQRALRKVSKETAETLGTVFLPIATDLLRAVQPYIESLADWIEANPKLARNIIIATAAVAGLVAVVGALGLLLPPVIAGFTLLLSPIGLIVAAIAIALIPVVMLLTQHWDTLKEGAIQAWRNLSETILAWVDVIKTKFENFILRIRIFWRDFKEAISTAVEGAKNALSSFFDLVGFGVNFVLGGIVRRFKSIISFGKMLASFIAGALSSAWDGLQKTMEKIVGVFDNVTDRIRSATDAVRDLWNNMKKLAGSAIGGIGDAISNVIPFAEGGVVNKPTMGLVGEAGPEAIIPLNKLNQVGGGGVTVNVYGDVSGNELVEKVQDQIMQTLRGSTKFAT